MKKAIERKPAPRKVTPKKEERTTKADGMATTGGKTADVLKEHVRPKSQSVETVPFAHEGLGARSGEQAGDLQELSNMEGADSESVDELLEEGNAFEADVVKAWRTLRMMTKWRSTRMRCHRMMFPASIWIKSSE